MIRLFVVLLKWLRLNYEETRPLTYASPTYERHNENNSKSYRTARLLYQWQIIQWRPPSQKGDFKLTMGIWTARWGCQKTWSRSLRDDAKTNENTEQFPEESERTSRRDALVTLRWGYLITWNGRFAELQRSSPLWNRIWKRLARWAQPIACVGYTAWV